MGPGKEKLGIVIFDHIIEACLVAFIGHMKIFLGKDKGFIGNIHPFPVLIGPEIAVRHLLTNSKLKISQRSLQLLEFSLG